MSAMARILIIDDDRNFGTLLIQQVQHMGHSATLAPTLKEGLERAAAKPYDVVLLDVDLPDGSGLHAIPSFRLFDSAPEVIIITGHGDSGGAALAIENGAWDYLGKGASLETIQLSLNRAIRYRKEKLASLPFALKTSGMVGNSPPFRRCLDQLARAAAGSAAVLIRGETGTGKELFAKAVHENSLRADGPFVVVDCAALPDNLVESVLFGHERGAFTGAERAQEGLVRQAHGGTLFLDEVGELPLAMQPSFLRVLQERRFRPVGSRTEVQSDFRLIAATNRNLDEMVARGEFRKDLLFRLQSLLIELPSLRERKDDIRPLALRYITAHCENMGIEPKGFSPDFIEALEAYEWPGNVRELVNTIDGAISTALQAPILYAAHLPTPIRVNLARAVLPGETPAPPQISADLDTATPLPPFGDFLDDIRDRAEKQYLETLLVRSNGDIEAACKAAGLGRSRLYGLLKKHSLSPRRL